MNEGYVRNVSKLLTEKHNSLLFASVIENSLRSDSNMFVFPSFLGKDGSKITTVVATPGQGTDRVQEVSYTDTKVIGNGSFGVVFQAKLCDTGELVAIKKVLQDRRFKVCIFCFLFFFFVMSSSLEGVYLC